MGTHEGEQALNSCTSLSTRLPTSDSCRTYVKFQDGAVFTPFTIFGSIRSWPMRTCCTY